MIQIFCAIGMLISAVAFLKIYFEIDRRVTSNRLMINQMEWDAYSKGMDFNQKLEVYNEWCRESKIRHGWPHYYFPRM